MTKGLSISVFGKMCEIIFGKEISEIGEIIGEFFDPKTNQKPKDRTMITGIKKFLIKLINYKLKSLIN